MKLPWVSRGRYEEVVKRLEQSEKERQQLIWFVFERDAKEPAKPVSVEEDAGPVKFTTPFDRVESRFSQALKSGIPDLRKFRVRAH